MRYLSRKQGVINVSRPGRLLWTENEKTDSITRNLFLSVSRDRLHVDITQVLQDSLVGTEF